MKKLILASAVLCVSNLAQAELTITGAFDGPLPNGVPKGVELYASSDIPDLSVYGLGFANNGGGSDGVEFTFPADAVSAGEYIYVATEEEGFLSFFGASPNYTSVSAAINGDDAIELFLNGVVVDLFGDINVDGSGEDWDYLDGWAKRDISSAASSTFNIAEWTFSGINALDNETSNATAITPFSFGGGTVTTPTPTPTPVPVEAKISEIQGSGDTIAISTDVIVSAIVTAEYQSGDELSGFFIQEEDADADGDDATSEGILVFCSTCPVAVEVGDLVQVTGTPSDFFDMSQITADTVDSVQIISSGSVLPTPAMIDLPIEGDIDAYYEALEGMRVQFADVMTAAEYFELGRFGEVVMTEGGRVRQFTDAFEPDEDAFTAYEETVAARSIILDDVYDGSNFALFNDVPVYHPQPGLSSDNFFRGGDTVESLAGVLQYSFSAWRIRPVEDVVFESTNPRTEAPEDQGGSLTVASFNVLNYFTTINDTGSGCGPDGSLECRGAHSADELLRQTQKLVSAICAIDADIVGLMELENPGTDAVETPIATLVTEINSECGEYAAIETGTVGTDAITVGLVYKPSSVELAGTTAILDDDSFTDPNNLGSPQNRPAIAQSFTEIATGSTFTVAVNHLKSKGSGCGDGDDALDGQGNCNLTRALAASAQATWLDSDPTGVGSEHVLVIGDLNAYRKEDPIVAFTDAGYTDVIDSFGGDDAYGYVFDGQLGYLDHALASESLMPYVTGAASWHINADEINLLDYDDTVLDDQEASFEAKPSSTELFSPDAYRSSDHDPVIIGLSLPNLNNDDKRSGGGGSVGGLILLVLGGLFMRSRRFNRNNLK